jgi:hypothetical protein
MESETTTAEAIRALLLRNAEAHTDRLLARLEEFRSHVSKGEHLAALGALEGTEAATATIRSLLLLVRDCFPPAQEGPRP